MTEQGSSSAASQLATIATARAALASLVATAGGTTPIRIDWYDHGGGASSADSSDGDSCTCSGDKGASVFESLSSVVSPALDMTTSLLDLTSTLLGLGSDSSSKSRSFEGMFDVLKPSNNGGDGQDVWEPVARYMFGGRYSEGEGGGGGGINPWQPFAPLLGPPGMNGGLFADPGAPDQGGENGERNHAVLVSDSRGVGPGGLNPAAGAGGLGGMPGLAGMPLNALLAGFGPGGMFSGLGGLNVLTNFYGPVIDPDKIGNNLQKANLMSVRKMNTAGVLA